MTDLYTILSGLLTLGQNLHQEFSDLNDDLEPLLDFPVVNGEISYNVSTSVNILSGEITYSLEDNKIYRTELNNDTTFVLPQIDNVDIFHEIVMSIKFNNSCSAIFEDYQGNALTPMNDDQYYADDVVQYLLRYENYLSKWCIMSVKMS